MDKSTFEKWICPDLRVILSKLEFVCMTIFGVHLQFPNRLNLFLYLSLKLSYNTFLTVFYMIHLFYLFYHDILHIEIKSQ